MLHVKILAIGFFLSFNTRREGTNHHEDIIIRTETKVEEQRTKPPERTRTTHRENIPISGVPGMFVCQVEHTVYVCVNAN